MKKRRKRAKRGLQTRAKRGLQKRRKRATKEEGGQQKRAWFGERSVA